MGMNYVITGGLGFIGLNLILKIIEKKASIQSLLLIMSMRK